METKELRALHAKGDKENGRRAYSDCFNHILIRSPGNTEHGYDLACAIRLREDLDRAIRYAALGDDSYQSLCG